MDRKSLIALISGAIAGSAITALGVYLSKVKSDHNREKNLIKPAIYYGADKFETVLHRSKHLVAVYRQYGGLSYEERNRPGAVPEKWKKDVHDLTDNLIWFLLDNFDTTGLVTKDIEFLFSATPYDSVLNSWSDTKLRTMAERVIPIAVMRELLNRERLRFNPSGMASWKEFSDRFQSVILGS